MYIIAPFSFKTLIQYVLYSHKEVAKSSMTFLRLTTSTEENNHKWENRKGTIKDNKFQVGNMPKLKLNLLKICQMAGSKYISGKYTIYIS